MNNKFRKIVLVVFGSIALLLIVLIASVMKPMNGDDYLKEGNYESAYSAFSSVEPSESGYDHAQKMISKIKPKIDSIKSVENELALQSEKNAKHKKKLTMAMIVFERRIKENMKDPDSYEKIKAGYDTEAIGDTVNLYVKFRGNNSLGGKAVTQAWGNYVISLDQVYITDTQ